MAESPVSSLAIDDDALYFATNNHGVQKLEFASSTVSVVADGVSLPKNLVLGPTDIYYGTYASDGTVERVSKTGGAPAQLGLGIEWISDLQLAGDTLYVLEAGTLDSRLRTVSVSSGSTTPFATGVQSFLIDGSTIYYVAEGTSIFGTLTAAPLASPTQTTQIATSVFANRLASDSAALYWITSTDHSGGVTDHVYYHAAKSGGTTDRLQEGDLQWEIVHQDGATVYVREQYVFVQPGDADEQVRLLRMPIAAPSRDVFATVEHTSIQAVVTNGSTVYVAAGRAILKLQK